MSKELNDVMTEYCLYDEYVACKEGWNVVSLKQTDTDMGKQITYWQIKLHCVLDDTYWECEFGSSYYNGVRDGYALKYYHPEDTEYEEELDPEEELDMWQYVNNIKSLNELAELIINISDEDNMIQGTSKMNAIEMSEDCKNFTIVNRHRLTRNYGIRRQAMYIKLKEDGIIGY